MQRLFAVQHNQAPEECARLHGQSHNRTGFWQAPPATGGDVRCSLAAAVALTRLDRSMWGGCPVASLYILVRDTLPLPLPAPAACAASFTSDQYRPCSAGCPLSASLLSKQQAHSGVGHTTSRDAVIISAVSLKFDPKCLPVSTMSGCRCCTR